VFLILSETTRNYTSTNISEWHRWHRWLPEWHRWYRWHR